ncbi:MAG: hypothetical protein ACYC3I_08895 [Gemmataceae bacterium]
MSENRKPQEDRKPEDYRNAAEDSLELAKVLAGQGHISDQDFLERMARSDAVVEDDGEKCGMSYNILLGAQIAREMLEAGEYQNVVSKWAAEAWRRWQESKFFKLWQEEQKAGRDPHKAFEERGWST